MFKRMKRKVRSLIYRQVGAVLRQEHRMSVYVGRNRLLALTRSGVRLYLDAEELSLTPRIVQEGDWEPDTTAVLQGLLRPGMQYLEVGCNIGYYSTLAGNIVRDGGRLWLFEANPATFRILSDNIQTNGLHKITTLQNAAVADRSGVLQLRVLARHKGSCRISDFTREELRIWDEETPPVIDVPAVSLDDYFGETPPQIDVIKMDAEGAEALIVKGMQRLLAAQRSVVLVLEFSPAMIRGTSEDPAAMLQTLNRLGFTFFMIQAGGGLRPATVAELMAVDDLVDVVCRRSPVAVESLT